MASGDSGDIQSLAGCAYLQYIQLDKCCSCCVQQMINSEMVEILSFNKKKKESKLQNNIALLTPKSYSTH